MFYQTQCQLEAAILARWAPKFIIILYSLIHTVYILFKNIFLLYLIAATAHSLLLCISLSLLVHLIISAIHFAAVTPQFPLCGANKGLSYFIVYREGNTVLLT